MKVIIFSYNNFDHITTSKYLDGIKHTVLVHTKGQRDQFVKAGQLSKDASIVVTGKPRGLSYNRNYALSLLKKDEWAMFWVDDLKKVTWNRSAIKKGIDKLDINFDNVSKYRKDFAIPLPAKELLDHCKSLIKKADQEGIKLVGFSLTDNPLFRPKRFKNFSLVDGRCYLVKKSFLTFDENVQLIDDMEWTAANIKSFGKVLIDDWILPDCLRYTKGTSFGSKDERMEQKMKECAYLVKKYPSFIQIAPKSGWPDGSHVVLRYREKQTAVKKTGGYSFT